MNKISRASKIFVVFPLLFVVCVFNLFPSCNVSTASLSDAKLCSSPGAGGDCESDNPSFSGTVPVVYCTAIVKNAPSDTKVNFEWKHGTESMGKADVETGSGVVSSTFKPNGVLEPGKYSVTIKINTDNATPVIKEFNIE